MKPIWHVYFGTRGAAGAYVDALLGASRAARLPARAFVSCRYAYRTPGATRWFFPLTDRIERRNPVLQAVRAAELVCGYAAIVVLAAVCRPEINIHLVGPVPPTYFFFRACRLLGLRIWVTCHDVMPHQGGMEPRRLHIFQRADRLVVHNDGARRNLVKLLGPESEKRIRLYPFPFSSYTPLLSPRRMQAVAERYGALLGESVGRYFLLAGVVRMSKGIDTLLEAWSRAERASAHRLVIAGKWADVPPEVRARAEQARQCVIIDRYLSDEELVWLMEHARFMVFPYRDYTHSGILLSAARHGGAVIVSDIELFGELLPEYSLTFPKGDAEALARLLDRAADMTDDQVAECRRQLKEAVAAADRMLVEQLAVAYADAKR